VSDPTTSATLTGRLLVATPALGDSTFERSVVLVLDHDEGGAVGVVLNRPTTPHLGDPLPTWEALAAEPAVVFVGGPVQPDLAIAIGRDGDVIDTVDLDSDPALATVGTMRVFAGYAGWSAGQLEDELARLAWVGVDSRPDDAYRPDADDLWHKVLARQPPPLNRLAMLPDDLSVN
jgi:putative transcriptional regulator